MTIEEVPVKSFVVVRSDGYYVLIRKTADSKLKTVRLDGYFHMVSATIIDFVLHAFMNNHTVSYSRPFTKTYTEVVMHFKSKEELKNNYPEFFI